MNFILILMLQLSLAGIAHAAPYNWTVCYDTTKSVPVKEFKEYPRIVRSAVLELLKPGDVLSLLRVDQTETESIELQNRLSRFQRSVESIYRKIHEIGRNQKAHTTDFGLILNHARRRIELSGKVARNMPARHVVVCVTDGVADGKQTLETQKGPIKVDYRVLFVGVKNGTEENLRKMASQTGFTDQGRILIVPFQHVREVPLSKFIGRSSNPSLEKSLSRIPDINEIGGRKK
jgi:hypothetical protein